MLYIPTNKHIHTQVPNVLKAQVSTVADWVGMDIETVNYVLALFLCYPLGLIMVHIPYQYVTLRHLFSCFLGIFLLQFTLGVQWIHSLITTLVSYVLIVTLPRKTVTIVLPIFAMSYMTLGHLHRQYTNYLGWDLDFTGGQMVLTMKVWMIAFNLYDGEQLANAAAKKKKNDDGSSVVVADRASVKCASFALEHPPTLLEYMGYMFCFSNVLVGPACEYTVYRNVIDGSIFKTGGSGSGKDGATTTTTYQKPPSNAWPTLRPLLISWANMGVFLLLSAYFPVLDPTDPQHNTPVIVTDAFIQTNPWWYRLFYCWMGMLMFRQKYYFGWMNAEGAQNIWYAGFDGFDPQTGEALGWETSVNMNILGFELAPDITTLSKEWNKKTSFWLTRYCYIRTNGSLLAVYGMTAFWHGFYPGYYFFFLSAPLLTMVDRMAKKKISPYFSPSKWTPYGMAGMVLTSLGANYMVHGFALLAASWTFDFYKSFYFLGHLVCIGFYLVLLALPYPKHSKPPQKKD
jgi:hypothetical protein